MKIKLLKKIRKNCHIKNNSINSKFIIYSKDFGHSIEIYEGRSWLNFLEFWHNYVGISNSEYESFAYERRKRKNKKYFNYKQK